MLYAYMEPFIHIQTVHRRIHSCVYVYIHFCMLNICIRHAWKSLGNLRVLGVFDMFSQQRSM